MANPTIDPDQQTVQLTPESGLRFDRCHFVRENQEAETPTDPEFTLFSDLIIEFEAALDPATEPVQGTGTAFPVDFSGAAEESEVTISYALQRSVRDTDGTLIDPSADALMRNRAYQCPNTHSVVARDNNPSPGADDPEGCEGARQYIVLKGAKANATIEADTGENQPTTVEMTYTPAVARPYHIYQPASASSVQAYSTAGAEDDGIEVTVEDEGAATTETLTLDSGATDGAVAGSESFDNIDAIELSEPPAGDVHVEIESTEGTVTVIRGGDFYSEDEGTAGGDTGVPTIGAGSMQTEVGQGYEKFFGDRVERPVDTAIAPELQNITLTVENNLGVVPRQDGHGVRVNEGNQNVSIETNVIGEKTSHDLIEDAFAKRGLDCEWELSRSLFRFPSATITEPPARTRTNEDTFAEQGVTLQSQGMEVSHVDS